MADSDPNVGVGTPIAGGSPGTGTIAEPLPYTLLSLPRFARILGINPVHFQGATGSDVFWLAQNACSDVWPRYSWQYSDAVSRYDLAHVISQVEWELAKVLGFHPAPRWVSNEMTQYSKFYRPELTTSGGRRFESGLRKSVKAKWGKFISGGIRGLTSIGTATTAGGTLVYLDVDGDGFAETARITLPTTVTTDRREVKVYQTGTGADQRWEIRPINSIEFVGSNVVINIDSWLCIDPDAQSNAPSASNPFSAVDITTTANYVTSLDVYREYIDTTAPHVQFYWEPTECTLCSGCAVLLESGGFILLESGGETTSSCPVCGMYVQDGCLMVKDVETSIVTPAPSTYDSDSDSHVIQSFAINRDPDMVKMWYRAGEIDEYYFRNDYSMPEPLSDFWAMVIARFAVARLERPFCSCANVTSLANKWQTDLAFTGTDSAYSVDFRMLGNPFGTKAGEVFAWNAVSKLGEIIYDGVVI